MKMASFYTNHNEKLNRFLYTKINPFYTAIFRIIPCSAIIFAFFYQNNSLLIRYTNLYEYFEFYDKYVVTKEYLILCAIPLIFFGIGFKSRLFGLISTALLFPLIFQSGYAISRQILLFALFFFSFLRSDELISIKRLFNKKTDIIANPIWPIRLIQIQLSVLYAVNAIAKTTPEFLSGEILKVQSIMLHNFQVDLSNGYLELGFISIPVMLLGIATVVSEYYLAIGFWFKKLRIFTAIFGIAFHIILKQVVAIGYLDYVAVFLYLSFLIPWTKNTKNSSIL